jgi:hypothetical protein
VNLPKAATAGFKAIVAGGIVAMTALSPALAQTNRAATFDPLSAYVGTWIATKPNESTPFLILRFRESNGKLTGTMSHFKIDIANNGGLFGSPLSTPESPVSDLKLWNSSLGFVWSGDTPLHGGEVKFVAEGTNVAYMNIPMSAEEMKEIFSENPGLGGLYPTIRLRREAETDSENQQKGAANDWEETFTAKLINQAEFQYRFDHGVYADYPTLLRSGQLKKTGGYNWTIVPINLQSETDPLPGYLIRLLLATNGGSYQLSIHEKTSANCASGFFSDETGVVFKGHTAECQAK